MLLSTYILGAAALAGSAAAAARPRSLVKPRATCNSGVYVLRARGTSETATGNRLEIISSAITSAIPGSFGEEIEYPASLDFVGSVTIGVGFLTQRLTDYAKDCPGHDVVLMGYSQGAVVTGVTLAGTDLSNANYPPISLDIGKSVAALIHFGDPSEVPGQGFNPLGDKACTVLPPLARKGQYEENMEPYADGLLNYCFTGDGVCCGVGGDFAAHVSYFGQNTTDYVVNFVKEQVAKRADGSTSSPSQSTALPTRPTPSASSSAVAPPSATKSSSSSPTTSQPAQYTGAANGLQMSTVVMIGVGLSAVLANL